MAVFDLWANNRCENDYLAPCGCLLHACNVVPMVTEKLRQNDETLKEVLEERQSLIAELLHVQPSDVTDKVKVRNRLLCSHDNLTVIFLNIWTP